MKNNDKSKLIDYLIELPTIKDEQELYDIIQEYLKINKIPNFSISIGLIIPDVVTIYIDDGNPFTLNITPKKLYNFNRLRKLKKII